MASPKFDTLHVRFSRAIEDPVDAGSEDDPGAKLSSLVRSDYLNRATREFLTQAYLILGPEGMRKLFQAMVDTQAVTFASAGVAVETTYIELPVDLVRTGFTNKFVYWPDKSELDNFRNVHLDAAFAIETSKIYAYMDGVILGAGTGTFYHIGYTDRTAQDPAGDTTLPVAFYDIVVDYAVLLFVTETNKTDEARGARVKQALEGLVALR